MLMLKNLGSALVAVAVLSLGTYSAEAAAKPHGHHVSKHQQAKKNKLHPACKRYLERRAAWYRYKGNKAELRENRKAAKAFRGLPYAEQKIQCQAAYQAFHCQRHHGGSPWSAYDLPWLASSFWGGL